MKRRGGEGVGRVREQLSHSGLVVARGNERRRCTCASRSTNLFQLLKPRRHHRRAFPRKNVIYGGRARVQPRRGWGGGERRIGETRRGDEERSKRRPFPPLEILRSTRKRYRRNNERDTFPGIVRGFSKGEEEEDWPTGLILLPRLAFSRLDEREKPRKRREISLPSPPSCAIASNCPPLPK